LWLRVWFGECWREWVGYEVARELIWLMLYVVEITLGGSSLDM
jgi:hypothetical protein